MLKKIARGFRGSDNLPIEAKRLNAAHLCTLIAVAVGLLTRQAIGWELYSGIAALGIVAITTLSMVIYNHYHIYQIGTVISVTFVCFLMLPVIFFSLGGVYSSSGGYLLLGFVIIFMLIRGRLLIPYTLIQLALVCGCFYLDYAYADTFIAFAGGYEYLDSIKYLDAVHTILTIGTFICAVILFQHQLYERELKKTIAASRAKSEFLAKVSHEIRTPMNAILGMTELAAREEITPAAQDHLFTVKQAGQNLLSIINDILDFSKIEAGKMELASEEYLLSSVINDVINIIKIRVYDSRLRFIVDVDCSLPNVLYGDALKIRQIMLNILGNSVKYTEEGYISFSVSGRMAGEGSVDLVIETVDSGKGIKKENLGKLYRSFTQLHTPNNFGVEGTGLGLAITHSFITSMGGKIDVKSEYGKGSAFTVTIPQKVKQRQPIAEVADPGSRYVLIFERRQRNRDSIVRTMQGLAVRYEIAASTAEFYEKLRGGGFTHVFLASVTYDSVKAEFPNIPADLKFVLISEFGESIPHQDVSIITTPIFCIPVANFLNGLSGTSSKDASLKSAAKFVAPDARVLVVDDIRTNLTVAKGLLLPYDMQIDTRKNGVEAVEAVKTSRYDLVLMDHMMPVMDGVEATARIRALGREKGADPYFTELPIVALTANAVVGMKEMFVRNGFSDFISKPIDTVRLNAILEKWIPVEKQKKQVDIMPPPADEAPAATLGFAIDGLDASVGLSSTSGIETEYLKLLGVFCNDVSEKSAEIGSSLEIRDASLLRTHTHALKNACAIVGALRLSEAAKALEDAAALEDWRYIGNECPEFLSGLERLVEDITRVLSDYGYPDRDGNADTETLKTFLEGFREALVTFDMKAIKEISGELQSMASDAETGEAINSILHNKLKGRYEEAVVLIDSLLAKLG